MVGYFFKFYNTMAKDKNKNKPEEGAAPELDATTKLEGENQPIIEDEDQPEVILPDAPEVDDKPEDAKDKPEDAKSKSDLKFPDLEDAKEYKITIVGKLTGIKIGSVRTVSGNVAKILIAKKLAKLS